MSSLIVLCPHCLTWIETHGECCTECGVTVSLEAADPPEDELSARLGECLDDLGLVKLLRRGWPTTGRLIATTSGLLFVPQFVVQPNGALEALVDDSSSVPPRVSQLFHWWSLPPWRRPVDEPDYRAASDAPPATQSTRELLLNSPGGLFISRDSIQRIQIRWGRAQIERRPTRSVSLSQVASGPAPRDALRRLIEYPQWHGIVAGL